MKVTSLIVRDPDLTVIVRIPALDVNVIVGSLTEEPTSTHFGLGGVLVMCGTVQVGVYLPPQRLEDA